MLTKIILTISAILLLAGGIFAQENKEVAVQPKQDPGKPTEPAAVPKVVITAQSTPLELAKIAQIAHGGDKFKNLKSVVIRGSADASAPGSTQTISASFYIVLAGDRSRFELNNPLSPFTQIFDGEQLYNSLPQIQIPPMSRIAISLLQKVDEKGYTLSALPDKKKKRGFRITTPDGYATDFYLDQLTGLVDSIEAKFTVDGRDITTAVIQDKYRLVDGLMIPEKFSQRLEFSGMSIYASFKAKDILINSELPENTFIIPQ